MSNENNLIPVKIKTKVELFENNTVKITETITDQHACKTGEGEKMPNHYDIDIYCKECGQYLETLNEYTKSENIDRLCGKCQVKHTNENEFIKGRTPEEAKEKAKKFLEVSEKILVHTRSESKVKYFLRYTWTNKGTNQWFNSPSELLTELKKTILEAGINDDIIISKRKFEDE
jgi:hypothetical protein